MNIWKKFKSSLGEGRTQILSLRPNSRKRTRSRKSRTSYHAPVNVSNKASIHSRKSRDRGGDIYTHTFINPYITTSRPPAPRPSFHSPQNCVACKTGAVHGAVDGDVAFSRRTTTIGRHRGWEFDDDAAQRHGSMSRKASSKNRYSTAGKNGSMGRKRSVPRPPSQSLEKPVENGWQDIPRPVSPSDDYSPTTRSIPSWDSSESISTMTSPPPPSPPPPGTSLPVPKRKSIHMSRRQSRHLRRSTMNIANRDAPIPSAPSGSVLPQDDFGVEKSKANTHDTEDAWSDVDELEKEELRSVSSYGEADMISSPRFSSATHFQSEDGSDASSVIIHIMEEAETDNLTMILNTMENNSDDARSMIIHDVDEMEERDGDRMSMIIHDVDSGDQPWNTSAAVNYNTDPPQPKEAVAESIPSNSPTSSNASDSSPTRPPRNSARPPPSTHRTSIISSISRTSTIPSQLSSPLSSPSPLSQRRPSTISTLSTSTVKAPNLDADTASMTSTIHADERGRLSSSTASMKTIQTRSRSQSQSSSKTIRSISPSSTKTITTPNRDSIDPRLVTTYLKTRPSTSHLSLTPLAELERELEREQSSKEFYRLSERASDRDKHRRPSMMSLSLAPVNELSTDFIDDVWSMYSGEGSLGRRNQKAFNHDQDHDNGDNIDRFNQHAQTGFGYDGENDEDDDDDVASIVTDASMWSTASSTLTVSTTMSVSSKASGSRGRVNEGDRPMADQKPNGKREADDGGKGRDRLKKMVSKLKLAVGAEEGEGVGRSVRRRMSNWVLGK